jgi:hypothetical protein
MNDKNYQITLAQWKIIKTVILLSQ